MAAYSYKDVCYRDDVQAMIPEFEKEAGRECDQDSNYDGDYWYVTAMVLEAKDAEINELRKDLQAALQCIPD